jgi:serine protease Do
LGVVIDRVDNDRAKIYGLSSVEGVFISATTKNGAADLAGLKPEDIILAINQKNINSIPELQEIIGRFRPGAKIQVRYWRDGKAMVTEAILKNQANSTSLISTRRDPILLDLGFEVRDLTQEEKNNIGKSGVKVLSIYQNSMIEKTNMAPNYIIFSVNGKKISNTDELITQIKAADDEILLDGFYEKYKGRFPYRFHKK